MKTMYKQVFLFCLIVCAAAFHAASGTESAKPIPASLDEAGTYEEIMAYANHIFDQYKNWKTEEDFDRFLENYPPVGIAAGRKIIARGGADESVEDGYAVLLNALNWSAMKQPEKLKELETTLEELKKTGKFPNRVAAARFMLLYGRWRLLEEEIPVKPFDEVKAKYDALVKEAKELIVLKEEHNYSISGPQECVLDMAQGISVAQNNPLFLEDALEDLVRYVTSERFEEKKRKENESFLRGYRRRMKGSPFELWGKTVEGADFNWNDYKGKTVLIDFTASWCGPCRAEMPNVVELYNRFHDQGLEVVCVGYKDTTENLKKMMEEDKIAFTMISEELSKGDSRGLPSDYYGVHGIPEIFLIGKEGRIIAANLREVTLLKNVEEQFADKGSCKPD